MKDWNCSRTVPIFQIHTIPWNCLELLWNNSKQFHGIVWNCSITVPAVPWNCMELFLSSSIQFHGTVGIVMEQFHTIPRNCYDLIGVVPSGSMEPLWNCPSLVTALEKSSRKPCIFGTKWTWVCLEGANTFWGGNLCGTC